MTKDRWRGLLQEVDTVARETGDGAVKTICEDILNSAGTDIDILLSERPDIAEVFENNRKVAEGSLRDALDKVDQAYKKRLQQFRDLLDQLRKSHAAGSSNPPSPAISAGAPVNQGGDAQAVAAAKALQTLFGQLQQAIQTLQNVSDAQIEKTGEDLFGILKKYVDAQRAKVNWLRRRLWLVRVARRSVRALIDLLTFLTLLLVVLIFHDFVASAVHSLTRVELRAFGLLFVAMAMAEGLKLLVEASVEKWMHHNARRDAARDYGDLIELLVKTLEMIARVNAV
jgi:hypothetical protein